MTKILACFEVNNSPLDSHLHTSFISVGIITWKWGYILH